MPLIAWQDDFALGINELDEQHKKMLSIINRLFDLFAEKKHEDQAEIDKIILEMAAYAIYHFETEEKYFKLYAYEKMAEHIAVHNQYRAKIADWQKRYEASKDKIIFFEISEFLHNWWTWHINNTDRAYIPFMKANGVK